MLTRRMKIEPASGRDPALRRESSLDSVRAAKFSANILLRSEISAQTCWNAKYKPSIPGSFQLFSGSQQLNPGTCDGGRRESAGGRGADVKLKELQ